MYCSVKSASLWGLEPYIVNVETDISSGMPYFNMVGLLSSEVREARERVRTAIRNSGENIPLNRITINLSPADRRKEGVGFDLPIALSLLCCTGRIEAFELESTLIIGELGLDGEVKGVRGILPIINMAKNVGLRRCIIPADNSNEGTSISGIQILGVKSLRQIVECMSHKTINDLEIKDRVFLCNSSSQDSLDFSQIYGQNASKRAITIAVAGNHNILFVGQPGAGKSMLASRIPSVMPKLNDDEIFSVHTINSVCGNFTDERLSTSRPFRAPHHSISLAGMIGGGRIPKPGEVTLANKGVLFLDELAEFNPRVIDSLRQPIERKFLVINRTCGKYVFPTEFLLVGAMNPCKCGFYPDRNKCTCSEADIAAYQGRISGAILDRIDICVEVSRISVNELIDNEKDRHQNLSSMQMKENIDNAVERQNIRNNGKRNAELDGDEIRKYCKLNNESSDFIHMAYRKFELSMRAYNKIIKVARTIADIEGSDEICQEHIAEALGYRTTSKYWR